MKSKNAKTEIFSINKQKFVILKISPNRFIIQVMRSTHDIDKIHGMADHIMDQVCRSGKRAGKWSRETVQINGSSHPAH